MGLFISASAIVEATDRVVNTHLIWASTYYDQDFIGILGLPSGTYKARFKTEAAGAMAVQGIIVYDTVPPQENANTVTDINNTGQSVAYPINVIREAIMQDSDDRVPSWLTRSGYKEGIISKVNYKFNSPSFSSVDDSSNLITSPDAYYGVNADENISGASVQFSAFAKSATLKSPNYSTFTTTLQGFIDGVQTLNNHSQRNQVKGGSAPSTTRFSTSNLIQKDFNLSCSHSTGLVFLIADTRGTQNDRTVILYDGTNYEKAVIDSFVVGTSYTIKKALTTVVAANVESVQFQGFHNYQGALPSP